MKPADYPDEYGPKRPLYGKAEKLNFHLVFVEAFVLSPLHIGSLVERFQIKNTEIRIILSVLVHYT